MPTKSERITKNPTDSEKILQESEKIWTNPI